VNAEVPVVRALLMSLLQALQPEINEAHWSSHLAAARESIRSAEKERRERIEKSVLGKFMAKQKRNQRACGNVEVFLLANREDVLADSPAMC
jgi:hypothetical protein